MVRVNGNSSSIWTISPPSRKNLVNDLLSNNTNLTMRFQWEFTREPLTALVQETISGVNSIVLTPNDTMRTHLGKLLVDSTSSAINEITIKALFPTFIRVPASGRATALKELFNASYVDCGIKVRFGSVPNVTGDVEWWELTQKNPKPIFDSRKSTSDLEVITFNDFVPPLHFSFFASTGIIGLYVGFVWLVGKFVRLFFTSISYRIMFDEMPDVDKVFKLCLDIYMVRETKDFELEEDLFAKLMFLYRSPETLIKWTKYKRD
ncbi:piezo-type mechanosensitive ion channel component 1-like [Xenia sp. Carnegie-2017]|uniref:piezo-type mechanosensitive ion channel component 1-like n=1 Tax=Xenia sp. Carnegie-2017 TaxID=2897299 RepID=UPI001F03667F|nr:piezo-type mechanosensitive ion channel component 1-like [Xenia sp. Carnegie-2017]